MQRLFSTFPTGTAGAALVVLRVSVAGSLLVDGTEHWALVTSFSTLPVFLVPVIFLCLGFLTPYASVLALLIELAVLVVFRQGDYHLVFSMVNCGILAALGPGAYSVDARLFGRRLVSVPPRRQL